MVDCILYIWRRQCSWLCYLWVSHSKYTVFLSVELSVLLSSFISLYVQISTTFYFCSLPNKVAIEKASTSFEISPNLRSPSFHEKSGNNHKHFLACSDTAFESRALMVWGRARYLSVTWAPHNIKSLQVSEKVTICFFETWMPAGGRTRDRRFSKEYIFHAGSFNHCTRAPALFMTHC